MYQFDRKKYYKLVAVLNESGKDKVDTRSLYEDRINCIATDLHFDKQPEFLDLYRLRMTFIQNADGLWCRRYLHTSVVHRVEETKKGLEIYTNNSIYVFENTQIKNVPYKDAADLIELYMSYEDYYYFGKGIYYDSDKRSHELKTYVNSGWFQDSVLLFFGDSVETNCVCRYFPKAKVEFYDTLYGQQDYSTPMLIHNTGKKELVVGFQMYPHEWKIEPRTSKYIIPYQAEMEVKDNV